MPSNMKQDALQKIALRQGSIKAKLRALRAALTAP